jgi:hypothetical protein
MLLVVLVGLLWLWWLLWLWLWLHRRYGVRIGRVEEGKVSLLFGKGSSIKWDWVVSVERLIECIEDAVLQELEE